MFLKKREKGLEMKKNIVLLIVLFLLMFPSNVMAYQGEGGEGQDCYCPEGYYCLGTAVVDIEWNCNKMDGYCTQAYVRTVVDCKRFCQYESYGRSCNFDYPDCTATPGAVHHGGCCAPIPPGMTLSDIRKEPLLTLDYMRNPDDESLNIIWNSGHLEMYANEPFSIIAGGEYVPATELEGLYFLAPRTDNFIIILGTHEGVFQWTEWEGLTRVREKLTVHKYISSGGNK